MIRLFLLLGCFIALVICAPVKENNADAPHIRVKRTGDNDASISGGQIEQEPAEMIEKKSHVGVMSDDVKNADEDHSAEIQSELTAAEDTSNNPDTLPNEKTEQSIAVPPAVLAPKESNEDIKEDDESLETLLSDLTEDEETDLEKLISSKEVSDKPEAQAALAEKQNNDLIGQKYKDYLYDAYYPFGYARKRRDAGHPAATAEDMMGMGNPDAASGRRIKRDLAMDELRTLLEGKQGLEDYYDYPDYETPSGEEAAREQIKEMLAEEIAKEKLYDYYEDYPEENAVPDDYDSKNIVEEKRYPEYEYPEDDLAVQQKLALMDFLKEQEYENAVNPYEQPLEQYEPQPDYEYPEYEESYDDVDPTSNIQKRQYMMSFVPGNKRSDQFYPAADGWWSGIVDPINEQKRNDMEYERLLRLAAALNGPSAYEKRK